MPMYDLRNEIKAVLDQARKFCEDIFIDDGLELNTKKWKEKMTEDPQYYIDGDSFLYRFELKRRGFVWDSECLAWVVSRWVDISDLKELTLLEVLI